MLRSILRLIVIIGVLAFVSLNPRAAHAEPGDELTISVLTFGPGDHPFYKFGHNALLVRDRSLPDAETALVYNYGTFSFKSKRLFLDFFKGRLRYWLSADTLDDTLDDYQAENRSVDEQELALSPAQRLAVANFLAWNALEENRVYTYDYYRDNCSTRIRDVVDRVTAGRLALASRSPAEFTWREHTLRLTADDLLVFLGLDAAMGDVIDQPNSQWEEMFLPAKLAESLRRATVLVDGKETSLVHAERQLVSAQGRAPARMEPPHWTLPALGCGALFGVGLAILGWLSERSRIARALLGTWLAVFGWAIGLLGTLFVLFWTATDHKVAYHNENILQLAPFVVSLGLLGFGVARGLPRAIVLTFYVCAAAAGCSLLGLVSKILPWFDQNNALIIALMLPVWTGATFALLPAFKRVRIGSRGALPPAARFATAPPAAFGGRASLAGPEQTRRTRLL